MSSINRKTNIYIKIERTLIDDEALQRWKAATKSRRKTCCIAGCKEDIYCCAIVSITNGRDKGKIGVVPVCLDHYMADDKDFPIEKQTGIVMLDEYGYGEKVKKRSNPSSRKNKDRSAFNYYHSY